MHKTLPNVLRTRPLTESFTNPPFLIITRLYIELIHLKSLYVLHKRYIAHGSEFSTNRYIKAAVKLVSGFIDMFQEFSPGGQLYYHSGIAILHTLIVRGLL